MGHNMRRGRRPPACGFGCPAWLLVALVLAPPAEAQTDDEFRSQARAQMGPLYLRPGFSLDRLGIETNVFGEPEPKRDFVVSATPRVDAWLPFQRRALVSATVLAGVDWYAEHAGERAFNPDVRYRVEIPWRRVTVNAGGSNLRTRRRPDFEIDVRSNRFERDVYGGVDLQVLSRLSVELEVRQRTSGFDADAFLDGTYLSETLNRSARSGVVAVRWRRTALTTFVLESESRAVRFQRSPDRDSDNTIVTIGADFHPRALISGSGRIGVRRFAARGSAVSDISSVVARGELSYRLSANTAVTFTTDRDIVYSFERAAPFFVVTRYGFDLTRRLGRQYDLGGLVSRDFYDYRTAGRGEDVRWNLAAEVGYRLNPATRVGVQVGYIERDSTTRARRRHRGAVMGLVLDYDIP